MAEACEIVRQALVANSGREGSHALEPVLSRGRSEKRQWMPGVAGEAEQGSHERAIVVQDVDLALEGDAEPGAERLLLSGLGSDAAGVLFRDSVVVGEDDGVLAGEVVVRGTEGHAGGGGDVAHGGRIEATLSKQRERGAVDAFAGVFAFGSDCFEHVQLLR
jgi:hypothetical protein